MKPESVCSLPKGARCHALPSNLAEMAFGERVHGSALPLFAYMWRRFGPPWLGSDGHKELANWYISTDMDGLWLNVSCKVGELSWCFGVAYTSQWEEPETEAEDALVSAMRDLRKPVYVRDVQFGIFGETPDCDATGEDVGHSRYAGYGMMPAKKTLDAWTADEIEAQAKEGDGL